MEMAEHKDPILDKTKRPHFYGVVTNFITENINFENKDVLAQLLGKLYDAATIGELFRLPIHQRLLDSTAALEWAHLLYVAARTCKDAGDEEFDAPSMSDIHKYLYLTYTANIVTDNYMDSESEDESKKP